MKELVKQKLRQLIKFFSAKKKEELSPLEKDPYKKGAFYFFGRDIKDKKHETR
jgi:hypothetical protein